MEFIFDKCFSRSEIRRLKLPQKKEWMFEPALPVVIIVLKGSFLLKTTSDKEKYVDWGKLFFLPPGVCCTFLPGMTTEIMVMEIPDCLWFIGYFLSPIVPPKKNKFNETMLTLPLRPVLWEYAHNIKELAKENPLPDALVRIKISELFCLLKASYSLYSLGGLFHSVLREEEGFRGFIQKTTKK